MPGYITGGLQDAPSHVYYSLISQSRHRLEPRVVHSLESLAALHARSARAYRLIDFILHVRAVVVPTHKFVHFSFF